LLRSDRKTRCNGRGQQIAIVGMLASMIRDRVITVLERWLANPDPATIFDLANYHRLSDPFHDGSGNRYGLKALSDRLCSRLRSPLRRTAYSPPTAAVP